MLHLSSMLRLRMRRRVSVAKSALSKRSPGEGERSLVGDAGADLACGCISISGEELGRSRDTVLFGLTENLGIGKELGGGEFEYVGPAQSSEKNRFPSVTSSLKHIILLQALPLIGIGGLFGVLLLKGFLSEPGFEGGDGVFGEEEHDRSVTDEL